MVCYCGLNYCDRHQLTLPSVLCWWSVCWTVCPASGERASGQLSAGCQLVMATCWHCVAVRRFGCGTAGCVALQQRRPDRPSVQRRRSAKSHETQPHNLLRPTDRPTDVRLVIATRMRCRLMPSECPDMVTSRTDPACDVTL